MNTRTRLGMVGAGLAALLAPLGLALTTTAAEAGAPTTHQLRYYSVQKFVTVAGEYPDNEQEVYLSCNAGDFAVEGTWAVDHVDDIDTDAGIEYGDERDVTVPRSLGYAESHLVNWWYFKVVNDADGNAQVNFFLTCLDSQTTDNAGHKHHLSIGSRRTSPGVAVLANGTAATETPACPANSISVAHGFDTGIDGTAPARLYWSWPTGGGGWEWRFKNDRSTGHSGAYGYDRCLSLRTQPAGAGGHVHRLTAAFSGLAVHLPASERTHAEFSCEAHNSFIAAGSMAQSNPLTSWYLGNSPRGRLHAHRFWNTHPAPNTYVGGWCLAMRTGKQLRP